MWKATAVMFGSRATSPLRLMAALLRWCAVLCVALTLAACDSTPEELPLQAGLIGVPSAGAQFENYRLAIGDRVSIKVFGQADLSGEYEVDANGQISFPLLGLVHAVGQSIDELRGVIADDLNRDFVVDPRVSVEVLNLRPFFILGQVNAPGSYPFVAGLTVRQAVAVAGGFTRRAKQAEVIVVRDNGDGPQRFRATLNARVLPDDTIEVERRLF
jgi:protein involved in polysaccharide export with SLBB domain